MALRQTGIFKRILIPLDFTQKNAAAVTIAKRMARLGRSEVMLLHVIEQIDGLSESELSAFYGSLQSKAEYKMQTWARKLGDRSKKAKQVILFGNRLREIVNFAVAQKIDLIVLSSHKIDPQRTFEPWSTLSNRIAILAQCPVLLVK